MGNGIAFYVVKHNRYTLPVFCTKKLLPKKFQEKIKKLFRRLKNHLNFILSFSPYSENPMAVNARPIMNSPAPTISTYNGYGTVFR